MKKIIIVAFLTIALADGCAQKKQSKYFKYEQSETRKGGKSITVEPIESAFSTKGKLQGVLHPSSYLKRIFCDIPQRCFSKEQIDYLCNNNFQLVIFFNMQGDIMHIKYNFRDEEVLKAISEKNLYKLYSLLKQTKLDTTKWGSIDERYLDKNGKFDFAFLSGPLGSPHCDFCPEEEERYDKNNNNSINYTE